MTHSGKSVGVVLVNWNCAEVTMDCVTSLLSGTIVPEVIVVVDNGSHDESAARIKSAFSSVHMIENSQNYGFTGANNIGIAYLLNLQVRYLWILNNDTTLSGNCLQLLLEALEAHADVAAVTGMIYKYDSNVIWYAGSRFNRLTYHVSHRGESKTDVGQYGKAEYVDFLDGCCILIRSEVVRSLGMFDEHFFAYHEDVDLSFRIAAANGKIRYVPDAKVHHFAGSTFKKNIVKHGGTSSPLQHFLSNRNKLYIVRRYGKWHNIVLCLLERTMIAIYATGAMLLLGRYKKIQAIWKGIIHGMLDDISVIETKPRTVPYN